MPIEWLLVAAIQSAAPAAAPVFAPPVGVPLILSVEQRREEPGNPAKTTVARRRIVFHRDGAGWRADMTHDGASVDAPGDAFARAVAAVMAQPIVFRLNAAGAVTAIDSLDTVWARLVTAMRTTIGDQAATPLEAMPEPQRLPFFASMLKDAIEADAAGEGPLPPEPIELPAAPLAAAGAPAMLAGTRTVLRDGELLRIETQAAGTLSAPAGATARIVRSTRLNPRTGLIAERRDRVESRLANGTPAHVRSTLMTLRYSDTRQETRTKP